MSRTTRPIPIDLTPSELAAVEAHAAAIGLSRHALMRACVARAAEIIRSLDDLTDVERYRAKPTKVLR